LCIFYTIAHGSETLQGMSIKLSGELYDHKPNHFYGILLISTDLPTFLMTFPPDSSSISPLALCPILHRLKFGIPEL